MLAFRVLRAFNQGYPVAVLCLYIGAFVLAFALMFVHPFVTILLLWAGLLGLVVVIVCGRVLRLVERFAARTILAGGACPVCGARPGTRRDETRSWRCEACSEVFLPNGDAEPGPADG